ncbi:MAG: hypothetical protein BJ554DRAFT_778, partial [Olpidium bornovanus]
VFQFAKKKKKNPEKSNRFPSRARAGGVLYDGGGAPEAALTQKGRKGQRTPLASSLNARAVFFSLADCGEEGKRWNYITAVVTHTVPEPDGFRKLIKKGAPLINTPLPQFYTPDEWKKISKFNYETSEHIHDAALPRDPSGKAYVVVRHEDFTEEMRTFLQSIGVRATLLVGPSDLQVKDETDVSEGESVVDG